MKTAAALLVAASAVNAHYTLPSIVVGGTNLGDWQSVRETANYQSNGPVTDVTSADIRCFLKPGTTSAPSIQTVAAGGVVTVNVSPSAYHPGPFQSYLAKVPAGQTAATWNASGAVWFRIYAEQPNFGAQLTWPSTNKATFGITIPSCIPPGDYIMRNEHIGLHVASSSGGAQFYLSCAQLTVTGGGSKTPSTSQLATFPGSYKATDPGILININYPVPTSYVNPGPPTFTC